MCRRCCRTDSNTRQREILTFHSSANEICIYTRRFDSDAIASRAAYSRTLFIQFILLSFVLLLLLLLLVFFLAYPRAVLILPVTNGFLNTRMPRWFYSGAVSGEFWTDLRTDEKPKASAHVCGSYEASTINNVKTGAPNCRRVVLWWASRKGHYS